MNPKDAEDDDGGADVVFNCFAIGGWRRAEESVSRKEYLRKLNRVHSTLWQRTIVAQIQQLPVNDDDDNGRCLRLQGNLGEGGGNNYME